MARNNRFSITNGPSKFDLMVALFDKNRGVEFTVKFDGFTNRFDFTITGVRIEDGSRESWLIEGLYTEIEKPRGREVNWKGFRGYYDTRRRTGWIENVK